MLLVPTRPGPLVDPDAAAEAKQPDEIDLAIDDMFGPDVEGGPGWLDAGLLAIGFGLILWSALSLHSPLVYVLGAAALALGTILPLRSIARGMRGRRTERRRAALTSGGLPLNLGHPETRELAAAYATLLAASELPDVPLAVEARSAAHGALVETAVLLDGREPGTPDEAAYVAKRVEAIRALVGAVERQSRLAELERAGEEDVERAARGLAGAELDEKGMSSLTELESLTQLMSERDEDGRA
jgi:hypothetical protein